MRITSGLYLTLAIAAAANAHMLAGDEELPMQLGHQLFGMHHLPLTILLAVGGIILYRRLRKSRDVNETRLR